MKAALPLLTLTALAIVGAVAAQPDNATCEAIGLGGHTNPGGALTLTYRPFGDESYNLFVHRDDGTGPRPWTWLDPAGEYVDESTSVGVVYSYFVFYVPDDHRFDPEDPWETPHCQVGARAIPTVQGPAAGLAVAIGLMAYVVVAKRR